MADLPGVVVPLLTPLTDNDMVDESSLRLLVNYVIGRGAEGLFALSTTGEFVGLRDQDKVKLVEVVLDANQDRLPVWVGIGDTSTSRVLDNLSRLSLPGVSGFVVTTPFYYTNLSQSELFDHFQTIADASELPVLLYNVPQNTHVHLESSTIVELSQHPNIAGIKDSTGDVSFIQELVVLIGRESTFRIYEGQERVATACLLAGAYGLVSGLANLIPDKLVALRRACLARDLVRANELQQYISDLSRKVSQEYWLTGIKAVAAGLGLGSSRPLKPWRPASEALLLALEAVISELTNT
jgi:dihydrodipicolinate synthase/N-acetylneuraminate lyase